MEENKTEEHVSLRIPLELHAQILEQFPNEKTKAGKYLAFIRSRIQIDQNVYKSQTIESTPGLTLEQVKDLIQESIDAIQIPSGEDITTIASSVVDNAPKGFSKQASLQEALLASPEIQNLIDQSLEPYAKIESLTKLRDGMANKFQGIVKEISERIDKLEDSPSNDTKDTSTSSTTKPATITTKASFGIKKFTTEETQSMVDNFFSDYVEDDSGDLTV